MTIFEIRECIILKNKEITASKYKNCAVFKYNKSAIFKYEKRNESVSSVSNTKMGRFEIQKI